MKKVVLFGCLPISILALIVTMIYLAPILLITADTSVYADNFNNDSTKQKKALPELCKWAGVAALPTTRTYTKVSARGPAIVDYVIEFQATTQDIQKWIVASPAFSKPFIKNVKSSSIVEYRYDPTEKAQGVKLTINWLTGVVVIDISMH